MLRIALCEDAPYFAAKLTALLQDYLDQRGLQAQLRHYADGESLLREGRQADLFLLDIKLPGADGMTAAARLRADGITAPLLFLTAYPQYVFRAFDLDAVHYLLKPVTPETLFPVLDKALDRLTDVRRPALWVRRRGRQVRLSYRDILYCEALDHQVTLHTLTGAYPFGGSLDALEARLPDAFFRCHKSFLVNLEQVTAQAPGCVTVLGGGSVPVSRRRQRALAQRLLKTFSEGGPV